MVQRGGGEKVSSCQREYGPRQSALRDRLTDNWKIFTREWSGSDSEILFIGSVSCSVIYIPRKSFTLNHKKR